MEQTDNITFAFNCLSENNEFLSKPIFISSMRKHNITVLTGLKPESPDYESCCSEIFDILLSQVKKDEELKSPEPKLSKLNEGEPAVDNSNELMSGLPSHLNFLNTSHEGGLRESHHNKPENSISLEQFKHFLCE